MRTCVLAIIPVAALLDFLLYGGLTINSPQAPAWLETHSLFSVTAAVVATLALFNIGMVDTDLRLLAALSVTIVAICVWGVLKWQYAFQGMPN